MEIKLNNSAKLLRCNSEEMELIPFDKKIFKEIEKAIDKEIYDNEKKSSYFHKLLFKENKSLKNIILYEKYAYIYLNYKYSNDSDYYNI